MAREPIPSRFPCSCRSARTRRASSAWAPQNARLPPGRQGRHGLRRSARDRAGRRSSPTSALPGTRPGWWRSEPPRQRPDAGRPRRACPCPGRPDPAAVLAAMQSRRRWTGDGLERIDAETAELSYTELRKRDRPFVLPLDPADPEPVERAAYDASYKGVTDVLTLYLWRRPAFYLTRWAAQAGMTPNQVTADRRRSVRRHLLLLAEAAGTGPASPPPSASWCSTRSTASWPAAPASRRNGAISSTMASTSSIRPSGGGPGPRA